jgi:hypothetical protein
MSASCPNPPDDVCKRSGGLLIIKLPVAGICCSHWLNPPAHCRHSAFSARKLGSGNLSGGFSKSATHRFDKIHLMTFASPPAAN